MKNNVVKKIAITASMAALALIFGYVEHLIPINIGVPGIKLGLANIVVVILLYYIDIPSAAAANLVRILLSMLLFSSPSAMLYALSGAVLSFGVMVLLKKLGFAPVAVSAAGGVAHNVGQLVAAAFIMENINVLTLLAVLFVTGLVTGILIGIVAQLVLKRLPKLN